MAFSYDMSLTTYKDKLRRLISDTVEATASFQDEELAAFESVESNIYLAAAEFCEAKGLEIARRAISFDTSADVRGGLNVDRRNQPKWWFERAKSLRDRAVGLASAPDEIISHFAFDIDDAGVDVSQYQGQLDLEC